MQNEAGMLNRSKLWATVLLLTVFVAGVAIGGPAWSAVGPRHTDGRGGPRGPEQRDRRHRSYSEYLQDKLDLTAEQRASVDSILELNQDEMHEAWTEMRARIDTLRQGISNEIMTVLDADQIEAFREVLARSSRRGDRERAPREERYHE